ncbi:hypothetical protein SADUNF_Sadunf18G0105900 [Salix dunnii]|uniref:Uncharacterized protein n=1 Tax=Salix dunnii TaxID=1413687 RepID=A0A835J6H9_9ROSI|nr:hypothetical protein SADUNF_Sadunf18G0105900 [Salix dunnii]
MFKNTGADDNGNSLFVEMPLQTYVIRERFSNSESQTSQLKKNPTLRGRKTYALIKQNKLNQVEFRPTKIRWIGELKQDSLPNLPYLALLRYISPSKRIKMMSNLAVMIYLLGESCLPQSTHSTDGHNAITVHQLLCQDFHIFLQPNRKIASSADELACHKPPHSLHPGKLLLELASLQAFAPQLTLQTQPSYVSDTPHSHLNQNKQTKKNRSFGFGFGFGFEFNKKTREIPVDRLQNYYLVQEALENGKLGCGLPCNCTIAICKYFQKVFSLKSPRDTPIIMTHKPRCSPS